MLIRRARSARITVALLASAALMFAGATSAGASAPAVKPALLPAPTVIDITVTTAGFSVPATVRPGLVTFRVGSPESGYHAIQGFATKNGATAQDVVNDLTEGLSGDRARQAAGARALLDHSTLIGTVVTTPRAPIEVTVLLKPDTTYYFFDLLDLFIPRTPVVHSMTTSGSVRLAVPPVVDSAIVTFEHDMEDAEMPMISGSPTARHDGTFLVVNAGAEIHEVVWRQVRPGITNEYVKTFYDAVREGLPRPPSPWLDAQRGLQAISPGEWAIVKIDLVPGDYAVICYVPSDESGIAHGWIGMHFIQTLT